MREWLREPVHTNCKRHCVNPHHQLEGLCEVRPLSRSFRIQPVDSYTLQLVGIPSQMCVFAHFYPLRGIHLATSFSELSHFFICQNNTCIEAHPHVPFGASRLSESGLHIKRARREVKISFTVLLFEHFLLVALTHASHPQLNESIPLMLTMPLLIQKRNILKCFNFRLCGSGLFHRKCELFMCVVTRS